MIAFLLPVLTLLLTLASPVGAAPGKGAPVTFDTFDVSFPGAGFTVVTGVLPHLRTGVYVDRHGRTHGWVEEGGHLVPLLNVTPQDASLAGITGYFRESGGTPDGRIITRSFLYHEGSFQVLFGPRGSALGSPFSTLVEAMAVNDLGQVCGAYRHPIDGKFYGFLYDPAATPQSTSIEVPGALLTACLALSQDGRLLLRANVGGTIRHYLSEFGTLNELTIPDFPHADIAAFHQHRIVGTIGTIGFLYDGDTVQEIEVPGARLTAVEGLLVTGAAVQVYGGYIRASDDSHHGFVATLGPASERQVARPGAKTRARVASATECSPASKRYVCVEARRALMQP